jgi:hypothetical protein
MSMKKRIISIVLALCLTLALLPAGAAASNGSYVINTAATYTLDANGVFRVSCDKGYVPELATYCKPEDIPKIRKVVIEEGVWGILENAFKECRQITGLTFPNTLKSIGAEAFKGCTGLSGTLTLPNSDTLTKIEEGAFEGCTGLSGTLVIPDSIDEISSSSFKGCGFTGLNLGCGCYRLCYEAFSGCPLKGQLTIPECVTSIDEDAFSDCDEVTGVSLPVSLRYLAGDSFSDCDKLSGFTVASGNIWLRAEDGVVYSAVNDYVSPQLIQYPTGNPRTSFTVPDGITKIKAYAFAGCKYLEQVTIPDSVEVFGYGVFSECHALTGVKLPSEMKDLPDDIFYNCTALKEETLPSGLTRIETEAFSGCTALSVIPLPETLTYIGSRAFSGCTALSSITLPEALKDIDNGAFYGCTSLTSITIPKNVSRIRFQTFMGCTGLTSVTFPDDLSSIELEAFSECEKIKDLTLPSKLKFLGVHAFYHGHGITQLDIPDGVTEIAESAFEGCDHISNLRLPDSLQTLGNMAFKRCYELKKVTIPAGVTKIGGDAFAFCSNLERVDFLGSAPSTLEKGASFKWDWDWNASNYKDNRTFPDTAMLYYRNNTAGWTSPTWMGYHTTPIDVEGALKPMVYSVKWADPSKFTKDGGTWAGDPMDTYHYISDVDSQKVDFKVSDGATWNLYSDEACTKEMDKTAALQFPKAGETYRFYIKVTNRVGNLYDIECLSVLRRSTATFDDQGRSATLGLNWSLEDLFRSTSTGYNDLALGCLVLSAQCENSQEKVETALRELGLTDSADLTNKWYGDNVKHYYYGTNNSVQTVSHTFALRHYIHDGKSYNIVTIVAKGTDPNDHGDKLADVVPGMFEKNADIIISELKTFLGSTFGNHVDLNADNTMILVTGHSLGGAVANIVAQKLTEELHSKSRVNAYTFASPLTAADGESGVHDNVNIKNYVNSDDPVPHITPYQEFGLVSGAAVGSLAGPVGVQIGTAIGTAVSGVFATRFGQDMPYFGGHDSDFRKAFISVAGIDWNIEKNHLREHITSTYMAYLLGDANFQYTEYSGDRRLITVYCPVNVEVLDASGRSVASVTDNKASASTDENVQIFAVGDNKIIYLTGGGQYSLRLIGTDTGKMVCEVKSFHSNEAGAVSAETKTFENVTLTKGKTMTSDVSSSVETAQVRLTVLSGNTPVKTVMPDGTEVAVSTPASSVAPAAAASVGGCTVTTPAGGSPVNANGVTTLPEGGTVKMPDGAALTAPKGTTIGSDGTITIPGKETAALELTGGAKLTLAGGTTIKDGSISVGGGAKALLPDGTAVSFGAGTVVIVDSGIPLGFSTQWVNPFADVAENAWYYDSVSYVCLNALFSGVSGTAFRPEAIMTRGMLVTVLWRMAGSPVVNYAMRFADVPADAYYTEAVRWAAANGIVTGYSRERFGPNDPVTREQLAAILCRYAAFKGLDVSGAASVAEFSDGASVAPYAQAAMAWAVDAGLIKGSGGSLLPRDGATRAQTAAVLQRFCQNLAK